MNSLKDDLSAETGSVTGWGALFDDEQTVQGNATNFCSSEFRTSMCAQRLTPINFK